MPIITKNVRVTLKENPNLKVTAKNREHLGGQAQTTEHVQARLLGIPGQDGRDGIDGKDGTGGVQVNDSANGSETKIIDRINTSIVDSVKWLVTTIDAPGSRKSAVEIVAVSKVTGSHHNIYGRIGDKFNTDFDVIITGVYMALQVTNNETSPLNFKILKFSTNI